ERGLAFLRRRSERPARQKAELQAGGERRQPHDTNTTHRSLSPELTQRGCVQTLTNAGCPDFPPATASLIAGPSSAGSLIGPFAHQPMDSASLWYSMSGFSIAVPIGLKSLPRLATRLRKFDSFWRCMTSWW